MILSKNQIELVNIALDEARLLDIVCQLEEDKISVIVEKLFTQTNEDSVINGDLLVLKGISELKISIRNGWWNKRNAKVDELLLSELSSTVKSYGGEQMYSDVFINRKDDTYHQWVWDNKLSLHRKIREQASLHHITLFQEGSVINKWFDIRIWFDEIELYTSSLEKLDVEEFSRKEYNFWDKFYTQKR